MLCTEENCCFFPCERCVKRKGNLGSEFSPSLSKPGFAGLVASTTSGEAHIHPILSSLALQREGDRSFALFFSGFGYVYGLEDGIVPGSVLNIVPACS